MNTNMPPFEDPSDARLHAALRRLPEHRAPDTLIPGVLAVIRAREQAAAALARTPWYRRPVTRWPAGMRVALVLVALALVAGLAFAPQFFALTGEGSALQVALTRTWDLLTAVTGALRALLSACATALRGSATSPYLLGGAAVVLFSYFALLGIGGAVWRTASQARQS
jgi:hypothetical protein